MPSVSYEAVADPKIDKICKDMLPKSRPTCNLMVDIIEKGKSCGPLVKSKAAMKACVKHGGKKPTESEKIPARAWKKPAKVKPEEKKRLLEIEAERKIKTKKTQCTKEWADRKAADLQAIDILAICGTKRIRDYAKCFKPDHLQKIGKNEEDCIKAAHEKTKTAKAGTNSAGFQCAKEFSKTCFKDLRLKNFHKDLLNYPRYEANWKPNPDKPKQKNPTKREFCALEWKKRKDEFITTDKKTGKKKLKVDNVLDCVIVEREN